MRRSHGYMTLIVASVGTMNLQENEVAMMIGQNVAGLIVCAFAAKRRVCVSCRLRMCRSLSF